MSRVRHDAGHIQIPDHFPCLLVMFTEGQEHSKNEALLPFIAAQMVEAIALTP